MKLPLLAISQAVKHAMDVRRVSIEDLAIRVHATPTLLRSTLQAECLPNRRYPPMRIEFLLGACGFVYRYSIDSIEKTIPFPVATDEHLQSIHAWMLKHSISQERIDEMTREIARWKRLKVEDFPFVLECPLEKIGSLIYNQYLPRLIYVEKKSDIYYHTMIAAAMNSRAIDSLSQELTIERMSLLDDIHTALGIDSRIIHPSNDLVMERTDKKMNWERDEKKFYELFSKEKSIDDLDDSIKRKIVEHISTSDNMSVESLQEYLANTYGIHTGKVFLQRLRFLVKMYKDSFAMKQSDVGDKYDCTRFWVIVNCHILELLMDVDWPRVTVRRQDFVKV
jgi:hypothetical protein